MSVQVGGFENGTLPSAQWTTVTMYPGSAWVTFALGSMQCQGNASIGCGAGGTFNPDFKQTVDGQGIDSFPMLDLPGTACGVFATSARYLQDVNVGSETTPNASLAVTDDCWRTLQNGKVVDCELGYFALGAPSQTQTISETNPNISSSVPHVIESWNVPGYLYNSSKIVSDTFGLHIGATQFAYQGSLIFGGFDKGRAIGPPTTWGSGSPQLLDVVLGVATGGSPFDVGSQGGLLLDNTSTHNQLPVEIEPWYPYISLPRQTCDNVAKYLPVQYDSTSGYYLWKTTDPSYHNVTTGAGYLGFVFPPAAGSTVDVTIKVPFQLLVLNLTQPASGKPGLTPYFPCVSYQPSDGSAWILGRAFLQSAFLGRNWLTQPSPISWLAQAPGPGPSKDGMGYQPLDIEQSATTLDMYESDNFFIASWESYWTPLPGEAPTYISSITLSAGAKAGVAIAAIVVGALAVLAWFLLRRRKQKRYALTAMQNGHAASYRDHGPVETNASHWQCKPCAELEQIERPKELPQVQSPKELDAGYRGAEAR